MIGFRLYGVVLLLGLMACSSTPGGSGTNPPPPPTSIGNLSGAWTSSFKVPNSRQTLGSFTLKLSETGGTLKGSFDNRAPLCPEHTNQGAVSPTGVLLTGSRTPTSAALGFGYIDSKGHSVSFDLSLNRQEDSGSTTVSGSAIADCNQRTYEVQLTKSATKK
jgi:hypothetical protein